MAMFRLTIASPLCTFDTSMSHVDLNPEVMSRSTAYDSQAHTIVNKARRKID